MNETPYPIWPGSASYDEVVNLTQFKFYNSEQLFISESIAATEWAARRLGYPITDIELTNENFISMFEEAVTEYSALVNEQNIKEYMLTVQGNSININLTGRLIRGGIGRVIELADTYGAEVGVGGDVNWKRGYIETQPGVQTYDLNSLFANVSESGKRIQIKRIFHERIPASMRYYDPWGFQMGISTYDANYLGGFVTPGNTLIAGQSYILRPIYEDLLRMQAIEFNDQIRRSAYSFEIINNNLRLFPIPTTNFKLWFDYVIKDEITAGYITGSYYSGSEDLGLNKITDPSNIPYQTIPYSSINSVGRKWIRDYFLSICKITLGGIRAKYNNIPIPNGEVTLDGESLRTEGINERDKLRERLIDMLEKSGKRAQIENKQEEEENIQKILSRVPLGIYIK